MSNEKQNIDIQLQFGDCVLLQEKKGFLQSQGFTKPNLFIQMGGESILCHRNFRDFVFQVFPPLRYDAMKEYSSFRKKNTHIEPGSADEARLAQLTKKFSEEKVQNKGALVRRIGEKVLYGDEIMLIHYDSGSMVEASKTCAEFDKSCNRLKLQENGSKAVYFLIEPKYKYRSEGQVVTYSDVCVFKNTKTKYYIHISEHQVMMPNCDTPNTAIRNNRELVTDFDGIVPKNIDARFPPNKFAPCYEVNCSSSSSKFTIRPYRSFASVKEEHIIKGGQVVRLQHSETSGYICSDDTDYNEDGLAEVFLWTYKGKHTDIEAITTQTLFELEIIVENLEENVGQYAQYSGNISNQVTQTSGGMLFRLRHLNTGRLVVIQDFVESNGETIKSVGLSAHYPMLYQEGEEGKQQERDNKEQLLDKELTPDEREAAQRMESISRFRLVSTGVDVDNRIRSATSVQIQHVESKGFLIQREAIAKANSGQESQQKEETERDAHKDIELQIQQDDSPSQQSNPRKSRPPNLDIDNQEVKPHAIQTIVADKSMLNLKGMGISQQSDASDHSHRFTDDRSARISARNHNLVAKSTQMAKPTKQDERTSLTNAPFKNGLIVGEQLSKEFHQHVDVSETNHADQAVLGFNKTPSFENAFFIYPEEDETLKSIFYVHASVNLLNSFLTEICSDQFGVSRERVKKIEGVLIQMIGYLEPEKDLDELEEEDFLNAPYSMEANDKIKSKMRKVKEKQKLMRELRVIESCVQILYLPFATGVFNFNKMTQDMPITSICKLTYILLGKIIQSNRINEIYASKWIGLYLRHILDTEEHNQIGADTYLTCLADENKHILEKYFKSSIIKKFIKSGKRGLDTPRLLRLLTALCSCQGSAIRENQEDIAYTMIERDVSLMKKFMVGLKRKSKRSEYEICLNLKSEKWMTVNDLVKKIKKIEERKREIEELPEDERPQLPDRELRLLADYHSFLQLLDLLAETCLEQNETCQLIIRKHFELKLLAGFIEQNQFPFEVRKRALNLLHTLHLDDSKFMEVVVPSETVVWNSLPKIEQVGQALIDAVTTQIFEFIIKKGSRTPSTFQRLKEYCEDFLKQTKGIVHYDDTPKNEMILEVLKIVNFMAQHGWYHDQASINDIASSVINILNGSTDKFKDGTNRYLPSPENDLVVTIKQKSCDILMQLSCLETDSKCSTFIAKLKRDIEDTASALQKQNSKRSAVAPEEGGMTLEEMKEFTSQEYNIEFFKVVADAKGFEAQNENQYICILFDLLLYRYPELSKRIYSLIVRSFLRKRVTLEALSNIQILESQKSIATLQEVKRLHGDLIKLKNETSLWITSSNSYGVEQKKKVTEIFQTFQNLCMFQDEDEEELAHEVNLAEKEEQRKYFDFLKTTEDFLLFDMPEIKVNKESQRLLRDFNVGEIALFFIKQRVDRQTNYKPEYIDMIKQLYWFLTAYARENLQNQLRVYDDLDYIMRDFDKYQCATVLVYEIFKNNKKFLTLNVSKFLRNIVNASEEMEVNTSRKGNYLKLLQVFCQLNDKKVRQNQTEIIVQFTFDTTKSNLLYLFLAEGANELKKHLDPCLEVHHKVQLHMKRQSSKIFDRIATEPLPPTPGTHYIKVQIFNVIQLLELATLCCTGKSIIAEKKCVESILSFAVAGHFVKYATVLEMDEKHSTFWPLKIAVMEYINQCFLDSDDKAFLAKPSEEENEAQADDEDEETDIQVLLFLVDNLNDDFEMYLESKIIDHEVRLPTGKSHQMRDIAEKYIFCTGQMFMKMALKRKTYDVGAFDMKFFTIVKNIAQLYYKVQNPQYKLNVFELLIYINGSDKHSKYLDDVRHPAKKQKNNEEYAKLLKQVAQLDEVQSSSQDGLQDNTTKSTKSTQLTLKLSQLVLDPQIALARERQFKEFVKWVELADVQIKEIYPTYNPFSNVEFNPIIGAIINLLDAKVLKKELQLGGIKLLRQIVEVVNTKSSSPAADWDGDEMDDIMQNIKIKQNRLLERGVVPFLCKLVSESEDEEIQMECVLVQIALLIGGNAKSQDAFFEYMTVEDKDNRLLIVIQKMLQRNFESSKKYLTEKNAKLEMMLKIKKAAILKKQMAEEMVEIVLDEEDGENEESDEVALSVESDNEENANVKEGEQSEKPALSEDQAQLKINEDAKKQHVTSCIRVLRFLQLLCEGHHTNLQKHLREQKLDGDVKNPKSFNFVAYCSNLLGIYVKTYVNCYSTDLGNQLIEALIEFVQGPCRPNQKTLVETKVIDCGRDLLAQGSISQDDLEKKGFSNEKKALLDVLKMNSVKLLLSILEGPVDEGIYDKVSASLGDFTIVISRMDTLYKEFVTSPPDEDGNGGLGLPENTKLYNVYDQLRSGSLDGPISEGFDIYSLLNQLGEVLDRDKEKLKKFENSDPYAFYKRNSGKIEVSINGEIQLVFFPIQPKCWFLNKKSQFTFEQTVRRDSQQDKIKGLLNAVDGFVEEMDQNEEMKDRKFKIEQRVIENIRDMSTYFAVMIALIITMKYKYDLVLREDGSYDYMPYMEPDYYRWIVYLGQAQLISSSILLLGYLLNQRGLVIKAGWRKRCKENQTKMQVEVRAIEKLRNKSLGKLEVSKIDMSLASMILAVEGPYSSVFESEKKGEFNFYHNVVKFEYYWVSLSHLIQSGGFIFTIQYLCFSLQGMFQSPVFYSFHLLDVIERFPTLKNVIRSVTENLAQLMLTAMLGVIIIYIYGVIAYLFIADLYFDEGIHQGLINKAGDSICMSLLHCFLSTFNYGLRTGGGIGEFLPAETGASYNSVAFTIRFFFDLSFFLLVIIILLNVVFGIIIDTFAMLREGASQDENDMKNYCFICGLDRVQIDRDTEEGYDFQKHRTEDHYIWNYVFFLIYLSDKNTSDMNGVESSINEQVMNEELAWIPLLRCLQCIKFKKKKSNASSDTDKSQDIVQKMQQKYMTADESINNLESLLA